MASKLGPGSSSAESDTLAPEHSDLKSSQPPLTSHGDLPLSFAEEVEALTIALNLLQRGSFRAMRQADELTLHPLQASASNRSAPQMASHRGVSCVIPVATAQGKPVRLDLILAALGAPVRLSSPSP